MNYPEVEHKDESNQTENHECNNFGKQHISECYSEKSGDLFGKSINLDWHKNTVHEELRHFSCPNCKAVFGAKQTMKKHILKCATNQFERSSKFLSPVRK